MAWQHQRRCHPRHFDIDEGNLREHCWRRRLMRRVRARVPIYRPHGRSRFSLFLPFPLYLLLLISRVLGTTLFFCFPSPVPIFRCSPRPAFVPSPLPGRSLGARNMMNCVSTPDRLVRLSYETAPSFDVLSRALNCHLPCLFVTVDSPWTHRGHNTP